MGAQAARCISAVPDANRRSVQAAGGQWLAVTADQRDIGAVREAATLIERELNFTA
jgi:hypothetical protein